MQRTRVRTLRMIVALCALSLLLGACSPRDLLELLNGGVAAPAPAAPEAPADEEPPAEEPAAPAPEAPAPAPEAPDEEPGDDGAQLSDIEREIYDTLNATREGAGLAPLALSAEISAGARDYSCTMAETGVFEHADLRQAGVNGENIATGQRSAAQVHEGWMNSPGHRDNRMNQRWSEYGVGVCADDGGRLYYTERFR